MKARSSHHKRNQKLNGLTPLKLVIPETMYAALATQADEAMRTPEAQAVWYLKQVLENRVDAPPQTEIKVDLTLPASTTSPFPALSAAPPGDIVEIVRYGAQDAVAPAWGYNGKGNTYRAEAIFWKEIQESDYHRSMGFVPLGEYNGYVYYKSGVKT